MNWQTIGSGVVFVADVATIVRALLRPHREPASRLAWIIAILALPLAGMVLYLLLGETRISGRRRQRGRDINAKLPRPPGNCPDDRDSDAHWAPFALASSVNKLEPTW